MLGTLSLHFETVFLLGCPIYIQHYTLGGNGIQKGDIYITMKCVLS